MSDNNSIGVFDSGVGGLTVLESLVSALPNENFIYVADHSYCPYGRKSEKELIVRVLKIGKYLLRKNVKAIVIACNTASLFQKALKRVSDIPIISVVEPVCEQVFRQTKSQRIGVIATQTTINSKIYQNILEEKGLTVFPLACSEFVDIIEDNRILEKETKDLISKKLSFLVESKIDSLILGCTHFSILKNEIERILGPINYIECRIPISKILYSILKQNKLFTSSKDNGKINIYTTGEIRKIKNNIGWFKRDYKSIQKINI